MPYAKNSDLPDPVKKHLPEEAQTIFRKAYNAAYHEYKDPAKRRGGPTESLEEITAKVAWAAVKKEYEKKGDHWVRIK